MSKKELSHLQDIPSIDRLEKQYDYISNIILRKNISITVQYIIFLLHLDKAYNLPGVLEYNIFKDIIIHTASIVESLICYKLQQIVKNDRNTMQKLKIVTEDYKNFKIIYPLSNEEVIGSVFKTRKYVEPTNQISFQVLIRAALRVELINRDLYQRLDDLRTKRNAIHLVGLKNVDNTYTQKDVSEIFITVSMLKKHIKSYGNI